MAYTAADFAAEPDVSRETFEDFQHWEELLRKWNRKINLVSSAALDDFWLRHALDSWQICRHLPEKNAAKIIDFGSGGGFPGLAVAIALKSRSKAGRAGGVTLVESAGKKVNFLRTVIRELDLPARALSLRIEALPPEKYDVITARAFAPLPKLLSYAEPFWDEGTRALLLKGEKFEEELTEAAESWQFDVERLSSLTDSGGQLLLVSSLQSRTL